MRILVALPMMMLMVVVSIPSGMAQHPKITVALGHFVDEWKLGDPALTKLQQDLKGIDHLLGGVDNFVGQRILAELVVLKENMYLINNRTKHFDSLKRSGNFGQYGVALKSQYPCVQELSLKCPILANSFCVQHGLLGELTKMAMLVYVCDVSTWKNVGHLNIDHVYEVAGNLQKLGTYSFYRDSSLLRHTIQASGVAAHVVWSQIAYEVLADSEWLHVNLGRILSNETDSSVIVQDEVMEAVMVYIKLVKAYRLKEVYPLDKKVTHNNRAVTNLEELNAGKLQDIYGRLDDTSNAKMHLNVENMCLLNEWRTNFFEDSSTKRTARALENSASWFSGRASEHYKIDTWDLRIKYYGEIISHLKSIYQQLTSMPLDIRTDPRIHSAIDDLISPIQQILNAFQPSEVDANKVVPAVTVILELYEVGYNLASGPLVLTRNSVERFHATTLRGACDCFVRYIGSENAYATNHVILGCRNVFTPTINMGIFNVVRRQAMGAMEAIRKKTGPVEFSHLKAILDAIDMMKTLSNLGYSPAKVALLNELPLLELEATVSALERGGLIPML